MARKESAIATELKRLALVNGGLLTPIAVVDAARDPESPLHNSFEWDDNEAAHHYRLWQARQLISVAVRYEPVGKSTVAHRVFVSLTPDRTKEGPGYRLATTVLSDEGMRAQLLADARDDMRRFQQKYKSLTELARVFEAMESVQEPEAVAS